MASLQETPWYRNALPRPTTTSNTHTNTHTAGGPTLGAGHIQVKFVNSIGKPSAKRKRTRAACLNCRKSKTKCDGAQPSCKACAKQRRQCLGYPEKAAGPPWRGAGSKDKSQQQVAPEKQHQHQQQEDAASQVSSSTSDRWSEAKISTVNPSIYCPQIGSASSPSSLSPTSTSSRMTPPQMYSIPTQHQHQQQHPLDHPPARSCPGSAYSRTDSGCAAPCCQPFQWMSGTPDRRAQRLAPQYATGQPEQVHPIILTLCEVLFRHAACHFGFLEEESFLHAVRERSADTILVNAVCAVASSLPDPDAHHHHGASSPHGNNDHHSSEVRGYASAFVARVKESAGMVGAAGAPSSGASSLSTAQALVVIAYGAFGADQMTSARVYLEQAMGIAATLQGAHPADGWDHSLVSLDNDSQERQHQLAETLRAMFILDRAMSSILSQPSKAHRQLLNLSHIQSLSANTGEADDELMPVLLQVLDYNSTACDLFSKLRHSEVTGSTGQVWEQIAHLESQLGALYEGWEASPRMPFSTGNLQHYLSRGQGTTFVLMHLWLHALFITLHQHQRPSSSASTSPLMGGAAASPSSTHSAPADSRKLRMTSANTIYDMLTFVDLIDSSCLFRTPLASHPVYLAAGALLQEANAAASFEAYSHQQRRHSLLTSAAAHRYETCRASLQRLGAYWTGTMGMLASLDSRAQEMMSYGRPNNAMLVQQGQQHSPVLMSQRDVLPTEWKDTCSMDGSMHHQGNDMFPPQHGNGGWTGGKPTHDGGFLSGPAMSVEEGHMMNAGAGPNGYLDSMVQIMDAQAWDGGEFEVDAGRAVPDFGWAPWGAKPMDLIL